MKDVCVTFTSKGQLVIPAELRRKHKIEAGTKAKVLEDQFGRIVLQPITEDYIDRVMGMFWQTGQTCWLSGKKNIAKRANTISENVRVRCQRIVRLPAE